MDIRITLNNYKSLDNYFAPDYEQDNEVLSDFKCHNPKLSKQQTNELIDLLKNSNDISDKYFVADLLYLYDSFDQDLLEPLLHTAINHKDPSFNRVFLRPCITAFGLTTVTNILADKFSKADIEERIGISKLLYWVRPSENGETENLRQAILAKADVTKNLIELYYYKLCCSDNIKDSHKIPDNAEELIKAIRGNK